MFISKSHINYSSVALFALVLSIFALLTPFKLISLPLILFTLSVYLPIPSKNESLALRFIFTFLAFTCVQQVFGIGFWLFDTKFTWVWSIAPVAIALLIFIIAKKPRPITSAFFSKNDFTALAISIVSVMMITVSTISGGPIAQQMLRYLTTGFDNTAHLSLTLSLYDKQGYIYGPVDSSKDALVYSSLSGYPQGWHLTNSILWRGVADNLDTQVTPIKVFIMYFGTIMLWYGIALFLLARLLLAFTTRLRNRINLDFIAHFTTGILITLLQVLLLFSVLKFGFGNYLALLAYLIAIVMSGLYLNDKGGVMSRSVFLVFGALLSAGVTFTWLLAAPIAYIFVFFAFIGSFVNPGRDIIKWAKSYIPALLLFLLIVLTSSIQGIIQILYSAIPGNINADGGMWPLNYILMLSLLALSIVYLLSKDATKSISKVVLTSIISFGSVAGFISFYQFYTAGRSSYYANKVGALLFIIMFIFVGSLIVMSVNRLKNKHGSILAFSLVVSLIFIIPLASGADIRDLRFANGTDRKLSPYSASQITGLMIEKKIYNNNLFVFKDLDYEEDVISTHFINMLSRKDPTCTQHFRWEQIAQQREKAIKNIAACADENPNTEYYIIASSKNFDELRDKLSGNANVNLLLSN